MILGDFAKAIGQMGDPRFVRIFGIGILLTFALLIGAYALVLLLIQLFSPDTLTLPLVGTVTWVGDFLSWGSLALMLVLSIFLMIPVASAITSLFLDDVAQAVEDTHYPSQPPVPHIGFWEGVKDSVNFLGVMIAANIAALVVSLFLAPLAVFIFYGVNGYLLGREYFTLAAMRRLGRERATELRKRHSVQIWIAGCLMAIPLTFPLINLIIPVLGAATFTHLFHRLNGTR